MVTEIHCLKETVPYKRDILYIKNPKDERANRKQKDSSQIPQIKTGKKPQKTKYKSH